MVDYVSARVVGPLKELIKQRLSTGRAEQFLEQFEKNGALPIYSTGAALGTYRRSLRQSIVLTVPAIAWREEPFLIYLWPRWCCLSLRKGLPLPQSR